MRCAHIFLSSCKPSHACYVGSPDDAARVVRLLKIRVDAAVANTVHLQLEPQARTVHDHLEGKVEIVKLYSPCRRQPSEQAARDGVEICCQFADVHQISRVCRWWLVGITGDQVVRDDQRLSRSEVPRVMERNRCEWRDRLALEGGSASSHGRGMQSTRSIRRACYRRGRSSAACSQM